MRILAIKWRRLGDTILWSAALEALRDQFPGAEIDLAFPRPYQDLFAADPRFSRRFLLHQDPGHRGRLVRDWRERKYDLALNFHASTRTLALVFRAGPKQRIVHHHSRRGKNFFSQRRVPHLGKPMAAVERDLNVVRALGWSGTAPAPRIFVDEPARSRASIELEKLGWKGEPLVLFGIGASRPAKEWPLESYLRLLELIPTGAKPAILYDDEGAFRGLHLLKAALAARAWLMPTPSLSQAMGALSLGSAYVGSDSGLKHLACAVGIPTVTIFGPESVGEWHGYDLARHRVVQKAVECRSNDRESPSFAWCGESLCPLGSHACMSLITPRDVAAELANMLG